MVGTCLNSALVSEKWSFRMRPQNVMCPSLTEHVVLQKVKVNSILRLISLFRFLSHGSPFHTKIHTIYTQHSNTCIKRELLLAVKYLERGGGVSHTLDRRGPATLGFKKRPKPQLIPENQIPKISTYIPNIKSIKMH